MRDDLSVRTDLTAPWSSYDTLTRPQWIWKMRQYHGAKSESFKAKRSNATAAEREKKKPKQSCIMKQLNIKFSGVQMFIFGEQRGQIVSQTLASQHASLCRCCFFSQVQLGQRVGNLMTSVVVCIALEHEDKLVIKMCSICSGMSNVTCSDANAVCDKTA